MSRKIYLSFFLGGALVLFAVPAFATPPSAIDLSYDASAKNLHIDITHVSINRRKHFIRRVVIEKNGQELTQLSLTKQTTGDSVVIDVPVELATGDEISVLAICSEAGRKEEKLFIP